MSLILCLCLSLYLKHTHSEDGILAINKNEISPFVSTWMDLEDIMLSEFKSAEIEKYYFYHLSVKSTK